MAAMAELHELVELSSGGEAGMGMKTWVELLAEKLPRGLTFTELEREDSAMVSGS